MDDEAAVTAMTVKLIDLMARLLIV